MPIPKPMKDEKQAQFISRCMGDNTMKKEFPDQVKRTEACANSWDKDKKESKKLDDQGREIIAENVHVVFTGRMDVV